MELVPLMVQFLYFASVQLAVEHVIDRKLQYPHPTGGRGSNLLLNLIIITDYRLSHHHKVNVRRLNAF